MPLFRKKRQHHLPKFPSILIPTFKRFCTEATPEQLQELRKAIYQCVDQAEVKGEHSDRVNVALAHEIARRCELLLELYDQRDVESRRLIIGAVRYFVSDEDAVGDASFATGFDDDARVVNYVLEQLEIDGKFIDL